MNILFTSVGRRTYLVDQFRIASDAISNIHISNSIENCPANREKEIFFKSPEILDQKYTQTIFNYCIKHKIELVIPLIDLDHLVLSKSKNEFKKNNILILSSNNLIIKRCLDKFSKLYLNLNNKIFYPNTINLKNDALIDEKILNKIRFPLIAKPRLGFSSFETYKIDEFKDLKYFLPFINNKLVKAKKENKYLKNLFSDYSIILQEFIEGKEYNFDIFNSLEGKYIISICKEKYSMRSGETEICKIIDSKSLTKIAKQISSLVGHVGPLDCDLMVDKFNKPYLLDLNPRFGGGFPFSYKSGFDYPKFLINELKTGQIKKELLTYKKNKIFAKQISVDELG